MENVFKGRSIEELQRIPVVQVFAVVPGSCAVRYARTGNVKLARAYARSAAHGGIEVIRKNAGDQPTVGIPLTLEVGTVKPFTVHDCDNSDRCYC